EIESVTYIDKKHNRTYEIVRDSVDRKDIILYEGNEELKFDVNDLIKIPIYNEIAAGVPITMNSQIEEDCYMPKSIVNEGSFILKVRGDSMIDANINDGDYVVIKSQNTAVQGEIIAAALDGEATLKKYMRMGGSILLVAENSAYEPIMVEEGNVNVMGVLVGIMKK
ncbi:MAG: transcriptional repressor LexA, partial [Clostridium sp.]